MPRRRSLRRSSSWLATGEPASTSRITFRRWTFIFPEPIPSACKAKARSAKRKPRLDKYTTKVHKYAREKFGIIQVLPAGHLSRTAGGGLHLRYLPIDSRPLPTLVQRLEDDVALLPGGVERKCLARYRLNPGAGVGAVLFESWYLQCWCLLNLWALIVF